MYSGSCLQLVTADVALSIFSCTNFDKTIMNLKTVWVLSVYRNQT